MQSPKFYCKKCHSKLRFAGSFSYGFERILLWICNICGEEYRITIEKEHANGCNICACHNA